VRALAIVDGDLEVVERPVPTPEADQALVRVHGAGLNRADLLQRAGHYPAPPGVPADVPGLEFAGEVAGIGAAVRALAPGMRVFGVIAGGAQAEYVAVHASHCAPVPAGLDLVQMGGVPEAFITAHDAMVTLAHVGVGEWVLVHAVGSGVGTAAVQLARAFGARVFGTARTADKLERCRPLGLDGGAVPPTNADGTLDVDALAWSIIEATGAGAHVTLDLVGGAYVEADVAAAAIKGRIVCIGVIAGGRATLPVHVVLAKRLHLIGTVLRPRNVEEKAAATDAFVRDVVPLLADGRVAPVVHAVLPLERAVDAYEMLASDATFGKVILDCG
jgi:putative PIG3 family NAD(P)H quinone oxidoreductase